VQAALAQITWYHNLALLEKLADPADRLWYARAAVEYGWRDTAVAIRGRSPSAAEIVPPQSALSSSR
jgi:hypothetical protein